MPNKKRCSWCKATIDSTKRYPEDTRYNASFCTLYCWEEWSDDPYVKQLIEIHDSQPQTTKRRK